MDQPTIKNLGELRVAINDHKLELAKVKSQEEIANRKVAEANTALANVETRRIELEKTIESFHKDMEDFIVFSGSIILKSLESIRESNGLLDAHVSALEELGSRIDAATNELEKTVRLRVETHMAIVQQEKDLSKRKVDLDLIKTRLEKKHLELFDKPLIL